MKKIMIQKITQNNWIFWTVNLIMGAKKIVNQSSDFPSQKSTAPVTHQISVMLNALKIRRLTPRYYRNKSPRCHGITVKLVPILAVLPWTLSPLLRSNRGYRGKTVIPIAVQLFTSVLWRCWLCGRKGIRPVNNWVVGCWRGYLSGARCRLAYGPADATASCFSKIQIGFTFLVPAHPGSPRKRAVKRVCTYSERSIFCIPSYSQQCVGLDVDAWVTPVLFDCPHFLANLILVAH